MAPQIPEKMLAAQVVERDRQYCANVGGYLGVTRDAFFAENEVVDGGEADLKAGEAVALVGVGGGLGHLGVQFAKALGLHVIAIDARDEGLQLAKESGADTTIDARQGKNEVIGQTAAALSAAVTKRHGVLVQIAQPTNVSVPYGELIFRGIRIHGSFTGSVEECRKILNIVSKNNIKVKTKPFNCIKEAPKAVEFAHSGKMQGKPVILIDHEAIEIQKRSGLKMI
ncbi:hypothetical protein B0J14DRAFT_691626 [Halenospora varia]|nr:hypothetical protein B0J14DRAFT_691626 [Halenospora varia]